MLVFIARIVQLAIIIIIIIITMARQKRHLRAHLASSRSAYAEPRQGRRGSYLTEQKRTNQPGHFTQKGDCCCSIALLEAGEPRSSGWPLLVARCDRCSHRAVGTRRTVWKDGCCIVVLHVVRHDGSSILPDGPPRLPAARTLLAGFAPRTRAASFEP